LAEILAELLQACFPEIARQLVVVVFAEINPVVIIHDDVMEARRLPRLGGEPDSILAGSSFPVHLSTVPRSLAWVGR
jgi:hypothetical protein